MNLIRLSIHRPVAVIAAVLMVLMFGILALTKIPIQLTPDVRKPVISLRTIWPGAAPVEIENSFGHRGQATPRQTPVERVRRRANLP